MIVPIQPIRAKVAHKDVWPAVVVVVPNRHAKSPAIIRHVSLGGNVCEGSIMVVVKQCSMRWRALSRKRFIGGPVHEIDVEPAIVVVVNQPYTGTVRLKNVPLLLRPHDVTPRV